MVDNIIKAAITITLGLSFCALFIAIIIKIFVELWRDIKK